MQFVIVSDKWVKYQKGQEKKKSEKQQKDDRHWHLKELHNLKKLA